MTWYTYALRRTPKKLSRKLYSHWLGPYRIVRRVGEVTFKLRCVETNTIVKVPVHANRMKVGHEKRRPQMLPLPDETPLEVEEEEIPPDNFVLLPKKTG